MKNPLEQRLQMLSGDFYARLIKTKAEVETLLAKYDRNFPTYTDHSIKHTAQVFDLASELLTKDEINNLNADEIFILGMACYLHDIGMCIPEDKIAAIEGTDELLKYRELSPNITTEKFIRDIHHELSYNFILQEWTCLNIPDVKYAQAIALVARAHRKVDLSDTDDYKPKFFVRSGREFVCLPYLGAIIRLADELDVTNIRTPELLNKYYLPNNKESQREWEKHISTTQINFAEDYVSYEVTCTDQNMLAALESQFLKIEKTIHYCQKIIRTISNTEDRRFSLKLIRVVPKFHFLNFDPKGIKFSFDVQNVTKTFIGEDLYGDPLTAIREAIQNSIDSCNYRKKLVDDHYKPQIEIIFQGSTIIVNDNGLGMDEFIIENFFGRLGSSFYEQLEVKNQFDAIGQFGIGVFSYFLISDYIDVSTRSEKGPCLKFRVNNDPKNYFHFFDVPQNCAQGTSITFNLKEKLRHLLTFKLLEDYIKRNFRYIDIPIHLIEASGEMTVVTKLPLALQLPFEIDRRLDFQYASEGKRLIILSVSLKNDAFEGECGIILKKVDESFTFGIHHLIDHDTFDVVGHEDYSEIAFSQKGVFINNYGSRFLTFVVGNVNLHQKIRLNISRQKFTDQAAIDAIIAQFDVLLIEKIFEKLSDRFFPERLAGLTTDFLSNIIQIPYDLDAIPKSLGDIVREKFYATIYDKGKQFYLSYGEMEKNFEKLVLIFSDEDLDVVNTIAQCPLVIINRRSLSFSAHSNTTLFFITHLNYQPVGLFVNKDCFQGLVKGKGLEYLEFVRKFENLNSGGLLECVAPANCDSIMFVVGTRALKLYSHDNGIVNSNHPFAAQVIEKLDVILEDLSLTRATKAIFDVVKDLFNDSMEDEIDYDYYKREVKKLNQLVLHLSSIGISYKFTKRDFLY